jgi:hypothetical protein
MKPNQKIYPERQGETMKNFRTLCSKRESNRLPAAYNFGALPLGKRNAREKIQSGKPREALARVVDVPTGRGRERII